MTSSLKLRAGDWVEVRSKDEILATLDARGQLEALPFMPEMLQYCGQRFQIFKRAHKTCDPSSGLQARRMTDTIHLAGVRCDGAAHGGCQAGCLIFWKEAWLKRADDADAPSHRATEASLAATSPAGPGGCTEADVFAGAYQTGCSAESSEPVYVCQSTRVHAASTPLPWWDLRQYVEDLRSRNVRLPQMAAGLLFFIYQSLAESGLGIGSAMRWAYDAFQALRGGPPYPLRAPRIARGMRTPSARLDLQPGEVARVRSYAAILETLDQNWHNRGMYFDSEQVPFCNGTYPVLRRVEKLIDEKTGKMMRLKNDAIVLADVVCEARYSKCRRFCPRSIYPYWREIWLERKAPAGA